MRAFLTGIVLTLGAGGPAQAVNVNWVDWVAQPFGAVEGVLDVNGTDVDVTFSTDAVSIYNVQLNGGTDYWQNQRSGRDPATSPYTSVGPDGNDNIPTGTDIIQLNYAGTHTLDFGQAIEGIYFSFVSINNNTYTFDTEARLLSAALMDIDGNGTDTAGYWGEGNPTTVTAGNGTWALSGPREPHGTLFLPGSFTSLSWSSSVFESWHGFTIGVAGVAPPDTPSVPLPAAGWLALAGLGALGGMRRLRAG